MVDNLRFFAGAARCMEGKAAGEYLEGYTSIIRREPVGVVGQIAPWNYPLMMADLEDRPGARRPATRSSSSPRPTTPLTTLRARRAGRGVPAQGRAQRHHRRQRRRARRWSTHPDVDMVSLTGSVETGKWIAAHAADTLKRVHLELGGKAPVVVFDDVDLETALETIAGTGYYNAGQDCTAATRVLAASEGLRRRRQRPGRAGQGLRHGRHARADTTLGPLNSARQRERVEGFLERRPDARRDRHRRQRARPARLLPRADRRRRPASRTTR